MSVSERHFWEAVRKKRLGFVCKRQVPVGPYFLDFYFPEATLCVETDGEQHDRRAAADAQRDQYLLDHGIATIRIPTLDLFDHDNSVFEGWTRLVWEACTERSGRGRQETGFSTPRPPPHRHEASDEEGENRPSRNSEQGHEESG